MDDADSPPIPDGTYDAIVVDAAEADDGAVALELTVLAGELKGRVLEVRGPGRGSDPIDLLGVPATITVVDGSPRVRLEP